MLKTHYNLFYRVPDKHDVYYRIFPYTDLPVEIVYLRRFGITLYSDNLVVGRSLLYFLEIISFFKYLMYHGQSVIIFEFTSFITAPFLFIASYFFNLRSFYLNVNANLNQSWQIKLLRFASKRLKIAMIEPSSDLITRHPWLTPIKLTTNNINISKSRIVKNLFVFTGFRDEQESLDASECISSINNALLDSKINLHIIGRLTDSYLSFSEYNSIFTSINSLVILLYKSDFYNDRHSGIVLESIVTSTPLIMRNSTLANHYISNNFFVAGFSSPSALYKLLSNDLNGFFGSISS